MLIPKNLIKILEEKGIEVQELPEHPTCAYVFSITSPKSHCHFYRLEWCESFEEAVSVLKKAYKEFSIDKYACYMYTKHTNDGNLTLTECVKEAKFVKNKFRKVLYEAFSEVKPTDEDLFKEKLYKCSEHFKKSLCPLCYSRGLIKDCSPDGVCFFNGNEEKVAPEKVLANYLHWMYVFEFFENAKFTEEQLKFFDTKNSSAAKLLVDATKPSMQAFKEEFINNILPDALNSLMNSQSEESAGDNNG